MSEKYAKSSRGLSRIWKITLMYIVVFTFAAVHADEDLYKVLGVKRSASPAEIKKSYKQLAREW